MVTASTYGHEHYFRSVERLSFLQELLLNLSVEFEWQLEAWAVLSNHYHFIARAPAEDSETLVKLIRKIHSVSARYVNELDGSQGRKVWHNYRDSFIRNEKSYFARLHYVHANAVHHGLVLCPSDYKWCSAAWFERIESKARIDTVYSFSISQLIEKDIPVD